MVDTVNSAPVLDALLALERPRLVHLCARLTGDREAAEDLAHDTLLEAWRSLHRLRDPQARSRWLSGIARNLCLRWARARGRDLARLVRLPDADDHNQLRSPAVSPTSGDLAAVVEQTELVRVLDQALTLLPPDTRAVVLARYGEQASHAEIAARLGISPKAVSMRLQRGKRALQHVLTTELQHEAVTYGILPVAPDAWQETRIWCPYCARQRLVARFTDAHTEVTFRCPSCSLDPALHVAHWHSPALLADASAFKPTLNRVLGAANTYFRPALGHGAAPCPGCGRMLPLQAGLGHPMPPYTRGHPAVHVRCRVCPGGANMTLAHFLLALPPVRRFWQTHPRLRVLPPYDVEVAGEPALVARFASATEPATLVIVCRRATWEPLGIHPSASA